MQVISAYLIRQVATDDKKEIINDIISSLKNARTALDPLLYIRSRFVKIGNIPVNLGRVGDNVGTATDQPDGTEVGDTITNGIAYMYKDSRSLGYCLYKVTGYDTPVGQGRFWTPAGSAGDFDFNWIDFVAGTGELWIDSGSSPGGAIFKVAFMWNVPLFDTDTDAYSYESLVSGYWSSGTDNDLNAIKNYLDNHMVTE